MKALAFIFLMPCLVLAQESSLNKLTDFQDADSNRTHVMLSGKLFEMVSKMEIDSTLDESLKKLALSIKGMEGYAELSKQTASKLIDKLDASKNFEVYAEVSNKEGKFKFYVDESDGIVSELILIAMDEGEAYAASVYGSMDLKYIGEIYQLVSMNGFKYLHEKEGN